MQKAETEWVKSPYSGGNGNCIELRRRDGMIEVRDSKNPNGPILRFTDAEVAAFRLGLADGAFDPIIGS